MILPDPFIVQLTRLGLLPDNQTLRHELQQLIQLLMEIEVSELIDAEYYERNDERLTYRNGYRKRQWKTKIGVLELRVPKLRQGTYTPGFLRTGLDKQLIKLLHSSFAANPSTEDLKIIFGDLNFIQPHYRGIILEHLHDRKEVIRGRNLVSLKPHLWLDAVELASVGQKVVLLLAVNFDDAGHYECLDFELTRNAGDEIAWKTLLNRLYERGLDQVQVTLSSDVADLRRQIHRYWPSSNWFYQPLYSLQDLLPEFGRRAVVDAVSTLIIPIPQTYLGGLASLAMENLSLAWQPGQVQVLAIA